MRRCHSDRQVARVGAGELNLVNLNSKGNAMSLGTILLIVLILMLIGVLPTWQHSSSWGYGPSGLLGLVVVILIILVLTGRL